MAKFAKHYYTLSLTTMTKRILVVDDEETLCEALRYNLEAEGYAVDVAYSAETALTLDLHLYDLILLDIMMGEISGIQFAKIIRSKSTVPVPIIFCTAKDSEDDMVNGLDIGADDYITKPYSIRNVISRVKAVLRRTSAPSPEKAQNNEILYRGLAIFTDKKICLVDGQEIKMPRKEFEILSRLLSERGRIFSREELLHDIWTDEVVVLDRVVDVNITRIRQKIGIYGKNIITRSGYGYGFTED